MLVGFAVPIFWGIVTFVFFSAPQSQRADLYWDVVHITSPAWVITPASTAGMVATPFLNALFYGAAAIVVAAVVRIIRRRGDTE